jgi:hypothetical protein
MGGDGHRDLILEHDVSNAVADKVDFLDLIHGGIVPQCGVCVKPYLLSG